jgi:hypothetical protein
MRIIFILSDETEHEYSEKEIKFAEAPEIKSAYKIYQEIIVTPGISLVFVYNEQFNDPFISFLKTNMQEIESVRLYKNNGDILFSGKIDPDSDIDISENTLKLEFLSLIDEMLDTEIPSGVRVTDWHPSIEQWELGNPDEIEPGEGALEEMISAIIEECLPDHTVEFPENWYPFQAYYGFYNYLADSDFPLDTEFVGIRLSADFSGKTILEVLKLICMVGFCRINIGMDNVIRVISYGSEDVVVPDGELSEVGEKKSRTNQIETTLSGIIQIQMLLYNNTYSPQLDIESYSPLEWLESFYSRHELISYTDVDMIGINSNLRCGDRFTWKSKNYTIYELDRDSGMIDKPLQAVKIKAMEITDV